LQAAADPQQPFAVSRVYTANDWGMCDVKRYQDWALAEFSSVAERDAGGFRNLVREAYHSAGGEAILLIIVIGSVSYWLIDKVFSNVFDTTLSVGVFAGLLAVLAVAPTDWYIKRRLATRLRDKRQE
jgi:hypothetical protein